ncbi:hypothetical protein BCR41DRAFT_352138 [Lobosporangium transversale]|uniref:Transmembrane protein n=1 Tax=Lobosporangium transversale TaxID=64571 RepID=A0A1Y2GPR8_9FUNG|nr:hypothetical protein BCR41DRAFT_352138 [Lobosporangium transversale]ORZ18281.1 hypothetical protein BCR41DRAFT_352138 [Lobosporangium transversale]|eukprot:XP_021882076.1 hypothetical protein BCR41DRAFT_352138 [Lobosporangium transversale]
MHSLQETIVIMCRMTEKRNQIYVFDGTSVKSLPLFVSGITPLGMVPMTGPSGSYVFMADINGVYSVPLTGASAGALISGYQQVNITDNYGATPSGSNRPTSSSTTGSGTGSGPGPNQDPTEITNRTKPILIGVFCGAIVLAIIVSCIRAYKRRRLERKNTAASVEAPLPLPPTPMKEADSRGGFQYPGQGMQTPVYPPSNHFYQQQEHQQQQQQQLMSQEYAASTPYQWPATLSPDYQQEKIGYDPAALYPIPPVPSPLKATPPSPENVVPVTKATPRLNSPHTGYVDGDGTGRTIRGPMDYGYNEGVNNDGSSPMRTVQTLPAIRHPQVRD